MMRLVFALAGVSAAAVLGCSGSDRPAAERGKQLFSSNIEMSPSSLNAYSCSTCHEAEQVSFGLKKPGATLAGATLRPSFWGGQENDLLDSINACRNYFMLANIPLAPTDEKAEALFAYLQSLEPGSSAAVPFDVVTVIEDIARGDAGRGAGVFASACSNCHGSSHTGVGRLSDRVSILPEDTLVEHAQYTPRVQRLIFIEKIRHGKFLGYGGEMPPFSTNVLSDAEVSDVLEYLGATGQ